MCEEKKNDTAVLFVSQLGISILMSSTGVKAQHETVDFLHILSEPPRPPQLLEARALSVNSVLLRWQHVFQAPSTDVDAFIVHYRKRCVAQVLC